MAYTYTDKDGKREEIGMEAWAWAVGYKGGSEIRQFGRDGIFHRFAEVDQAKAEVLTMYATDGSGRRFDLYLKPGMKIFHFYRVVVLNHGRPEELRARIYCFGWKDEGVSTYQYVLPSGNLVIAAGHDLAELSGIVEADREAHKT